MWYFERDGERIGPVAASVIRDKMASGELSRHSLVWQDGMKRWLPLSESTLGNMVSLERSDTDNPFAPPSASLAGGTALPERSRPYRSARGLARGITGCLIISALGDIIYFVADGDSYPAGPPLVGFLLIYLVALLACIVLWCLWTHRMASNLRAFSPGPFEFTPGWSVGWYFIPILFLWKPMQAVQEIWRHTTGSIPPIVRYWWTLWIVSGLVSLFEGIDSRWFDFLVAALGTASAAAAYLLVQKLTRAQGNKAKAELSIRSFGESRA